MYFLPTNGNSGLHTAIRDWNKPIRGFSIPNKWRETVGFGSTESLKILIQTVNNRFNQVG
jgi:hypothetical protein